MGTPVPSGEMEFDKRRSSKATDNEAGSQQDSDMEYETPSYNIVPKYSNAYRTLLIVLFVIVIVFALFLGYGHYSSLVSTKELI